MARAQVESHFGFDCLRANCRFVPALHWLDGEHLLADLGQVTAISPQIDQAGPVHITFIYSDANPSLD
jgi:hypothetical protein